MDLVGLNRFCNTLRRGLVTSAQYLDICADGVLGQAQAKRIA